MELEAKHTEFSYFVNIVCSQALIPNHHIATVLCSCPPSPLQPLHTMLGCPHKASLRPPNLIEPSLYDTHIFTAATVSVKTVMGKR